MSLRSLLPLLKLAAAASAVLLLIDLALFRSGLYFDLAKPDSTAGAVVGAELAIARYYDPARKNVLVLGNSRIGEGFSMLAADTAAERGDLHFVNGSIAGTTPRIWYYLLRAVDPDADRFAAIALMVDYDSAGDRYDMPNFASDTSYLLPLLRLSDYADYPASFSAADERERARRAILLPLQASRGDVLDLLAHPLRRFRELHTRKGWLAAIGVYPGRDAQLPPLTIDAAIGEPSDWGPDAAELKPKLQRYFEELRERIDPAQQVRNDEYQREWLGRIAQRYAARHVPVIVFVVPRGPWHETLTPAPVARGAVADLAAAGAIVALPGDAFVALEEPQFFFDTVHMNRFGRAAFSVRFAREVAPLVH